MKKPNLINKAITMRNKNKEVNPAKDPSQVYREEMENKGSSFLDNA